MSDRDPFAEGSEAFIAGKSETSNPYDPVTELDAHCSWNDGWNSALDCAEEDE